MPSKKTKIIASYKALKTKVLNSGSSTSSEREPLLPTRFPTKETLASLLQKYRRVSDVEEHVDQEDIRESLNADSSYTCNFCNSCTPFIMSVKLSRNLQRTFLFVLLIFVLIILMFATVFLTTVYPMLEFARITGVEVRNFDIQSISVNVDMYLPRGIGLSNGYYTVYRDSTELGRVDCPSGGNCNFKFGSEFERLVESEFIEKTGTTERIVLRGGVNVGWLVFWKWVGVDRELPMNFGKNWGMDLLS